VADAWKSVVAIAASDLLTGLWPLPVYVRFFAVAAERDDWVPYSWCYAYFCLIDYLPTVFHTTSIWLTVLLAARPACSSQDPASDAGKTIFARHRPRDHKPRDQHRNERPLDITYLAKYY